MRERILLVSAMSVALTGGVLAVRQIAFRAVMPLVASVGGQAAQMMFSRTAEASENRIGNHFNGMAAMGAMGGLTLLPEPSSAPSQDPTPAPLANIDDQLLAAPASACGAGMILVEGEYCPEVEHVCAKWMETTGRYAKYRCEQYTSAKCLSKKRQHMSFCIDRDEFMKPGEKLPASHSSWNDAERECSAQGKRVCLESEYNFACEGEEMRPYPYGWRRDPTACNADRTDIYTPDSKLRDLRSGPDEFPRCVSPFGVHNLAGNLEEWTTIDASAKLGAPRPAMKGAYWQPSRNHCRAAQTAHDRFYKGTETGFRCCSDSK